MSLEQFIENLTEEDLKIINERYKNKSSIENYSFSKITENDLDNLLDIEKKIDKQKFNNWFNNNIDIHSDTIDFLNELIDKNIDFISDYFEEDLKAKFIIPLLNHINFVSIENEFRDFYELPMTYKTDKFIFSGTTDFVISKGLLKSKKPYFFIQEFKKSKSTNPEPQLVAELISAIELNSFQSIKGAYIFGAIWNFVILEKIGDNKYQYFVSHNFDSTKIDDLKKIYSNLLFIKNEIIDIIQKENN
jgi:hypothetical protein